MYNSINPQNETLIINQGNEWEAMAGASLPDHIISMPPPQPHQRFASIHSTITPPTQENDVNQGDHLFQRTDQWLPVYTWLESIKDTEEVVKSEDILDWLSANPDVRDDLHSRHSRGHLMHYIKQRHLKILKRKERKKGLPFTDKANAAIVLKGEERKMEVPLPCNAMNNLPTDSDMFLAKRSEAFHKYEILVDLEKQLSTLFPKPQLLNK